MGNWEQFIQLIKGWMKEGGHGNERFACYRLNQHPHLMNDPLSPTTGQSLFDLVYHDTKNG